MIAPPTREAYEALVNEVKALKEELERERSEKKETGRSTTEVVLKHCKTRVRKANRNSLIDIYNETTALRKHKLLLGQAVQTDDGLECRIKWAQRGIGLFGLLGLVFNFAAQDIATSVFAALVVISACTLFYKNISFVIAKRLLREINVVIILLLCLCNWSIDLARPATSLSPILGFIYILIVSSFVFIDAVKVKSRVFVLAIAIMFILVNIDEIIHTTFRDAYQDVVLLKYTIEGNEYTLMKRSTKRSIFIQIMLFGMIAIYILFKDRKQELMVFATGNIYRETGTASKEVEDKKHSMKIKLEKRILSV